MDGTLADLKLTLFRLAREEGLEIFDVGQGRGAECQWLSVLCTINPTSCACHAGRYKWNYQVVDSFRAQVAEWLRVHGDKWIGGETLRSLALTEWRGGTGGLSSEEEQKHWERYLAGVAQARFGQWGDNFTIMAISGLLKRMIVVLSVGTSKKLSVFEIEPPDHVGEGESSGVPLILSHFGAYHYMPVRVKREGPWGWVLSDVGAEKEQRDTTDAFSRMPQEMEMSVPVIQGRRVAFLSPSDGQTPALWFHKRRRSSPHQRRVAFLPLSDGW